MTSAARLNDEPSGPVGPRQHLRALVKIAVASAWRRRLDFCSGSNPEVKSDSRRVRSTPQSVSCHESTSRRMRLTSTAISFDDRGWTIGLVNGLAAGAGAVDDAPSSVRTNGAAGPRQVCVALRCPTQSRQRLLRRYRRIRSRAKRFPNP